MEHDYDIEPTIDCPEKEEFLDNEDLEKGYGYYPSKKECITNFSRGKCSGSCGQKFLDETTLYLFDANAGKFGFKKFEKVKEELVDGKKTTITETVVGFYSDEYRHSAFIHGNTNIELLPNGFKARLDTLKKIESIYEGENYVLIKVDGKEFAFNSNLHRIIKDTIASIDYEYSFRIKEYQITSDGTLLSILMDDDSRFLISGLIGYNDYAEEERIVLLTKVDAAQPFFNFKPYKKVDWSKLKDAKGTHFESLTEMVLSKTPNLTDIQPIGKTNASDRGRDFIVKENMRGVDGKFREIKWLVQCKFSENSISTKTLSGWTERVFEHKVNGYWLITNNDLTPDLYDQLKDASSDSRLMLETRIWQRNKFDILFNTRPELFTKDNFD